MKSNERFNWAGTILDPVENDQILEIGCGAGLLVDEIASRFDTGMITAIDKSSSMIRRAAKRNSKHVSNGKLRFFVTDFLNSDFKTHEFDKILAFNVNFFWKAAQRPLEMIRRILKPDGLLYVFYQAPFDIDIKAAEPLKNELKQNSFSIVHTDFRQMTPSSAFCIKAKPKQ